MTVQGIPSLTRMELFNFDTGESKVVHSNPAELEEGVSALWSKLHPKGWSGAKLHYDGTDNRPINFTLYFDADKVDVSTAEEGTGGAEAIMDWRKFLMSFVYAPLRNDGALGEPSDAVFIWPNFMSFRTKIDSVRFRYVRWKSDGTPDIFTAAVSLVSVSDVLVTSQDVRNEGPGKIEFIFG